MTLALDRIPTPESLLSQRDPRWKLAAIVAAVAVVSTLQTVPASAAASLGSLVLIAVGRVPLRWYGGRLAGLAPFFLLFGLCVPFLVRSAEPWLEWGPFALSPRGLHVAALVCLKAFTVVTLVLVLLTAAPFHVTLSAAHALRVPGLLIQLTLLSYRYLFLLSEELTRLRTALRVRGFRARARLHSYRTVAHVAGALLVRSHERAERVGHAMLCRGFDGRFRSLTQWRTTPGDWLFFGMVASLAAALWVGDLLAR